MSEVIQPNSPEANKLKPITAIGKTIGDLQILERAGNGRVRAKCLLCGNDKYVTQWYKIKSGHSTSCGCKHKIVNPEKYIGQKFHKLTIVSVHPTRTDTGSVQVRCKCDCGNYCIRVLNVVYRGKVQSCGCAHTTRGGLSASTNSKIYDIWRQMMLRCYQSGKHITNDPSLLFLNHDKPHPRYKDYGARGITVCKEWHNLNTFSKWYAQNVQEGESMDRANNDGPYAPYNVNSATDGHQSRNQRIRKDNKSGVKGVVQESGRDSWYWTIRHNKQPVSRHGFTTLGEALLERNVYIVTHDLPHKIQAPLNMLELEPIKYGNRWLIGLRIAGTTRWDASVTIWDRKSDPVLQKVLKGMRADHKAVTEIAPHTPRGRKAKMPKVDKDSPYTGVGKTGDLWGWAIEYRGDTIRKGGYRTAEAAVLERDIHIIRLGLDEPLQLPTGTMRIQLLKPDYAWCIHVLAADNEWTRSLTSWSYGKHKEAQKVLSALTAVLDTD